MVDHIAKLQALPLLSSLGAIYAMPNFSGYGNFVNGPYYYAWTAGGTSSVPSAVVAASMTGIPYYYKAARFYYPPTATSPYYNNPVSLARYYNVLVPWTRQDEQRAVYFHAHAPASLYYSTPTSSAQHFSTIFYSHASAGAPVRQHYSHSRARIAFKPFNSTR
jgi:hypothetical protein